MTDYLNAYNRTLSPLLAPLDTPVGSSIARLFLVLYGGLAAPHLPPSILAYFDNPIFRIVIMALILWLSLKDPVTSILLATAFLVSMNTLSGKKPFERFGLSGGCGCDQPPQRQ
jgi:hypothetical protein